MRTIILRSLQALVSISAVVILTGANDAGCSLGDETSGGGGAGAEGGGTAGGNTGTGIACPDGTTPTMVCGAAEPGCGTPPPACDCPPPPMCPPGAMCPPAPTCDCPPPPDCHIECLPLIGVCPMGTHRETVCDPGEPKPMDPGDPNDPPPPPPMDAGAPPSMGGMGSSGPMYPGGGCRDLCVPDSMCPPGTVQQTICSGGTPMDPSDPADPMMPTPVPGECWNECVPVVDPVCPPGTHPEESCEDGNMGEGTCSLTCVPDAPMN